MNTNKRWYRIIAVNLCDTRSTLCHYIKDAPKAVAELVADYNEGGYSTQCACPRYLAPEVYKFVAEGSGAPYEDMY